MVGDEKILVPSDYFFWFLIGICSAFGFFSFLVNGFSIWQICLFFGLILTVVFIFNFWWRWLAVSFLLGFFLVILRIYFWQGEAWSLTLPEFLMNFLNQTRLVFASSLQRLFPEPVASFAQGIILGGEGIKFSNDFWQSLKITSTAHVVAVSGYNITLIARGISNFLVWVTLHRKLIWYFAILGVFLFVVLVGAPASAVRAGIFSVLLIIAERFGRQQNTRIAFALILALMLLASPLALKNDLGFQLSFLASFGIFYVKPRLMRAGIFENNEDENRGFDWKNMILETLSAQAMVLPLLLFKFGTLSLVGMLANFLILPMIPLAMSLSFLSGLGMILSEFFGRVIGFLSYPFLALIIKIIEFFSGLPGAGMQGIYIGSWFLIVCYLGIIVFLVFSRKNEN